MQDERRLHRPRGAQLLARIQARELHRQARVPARRLDPNDGGCSPVLDEMGEPLGDEACASGFCGAFKYMKLLELGACGECSADSDCQPGEVCTAPQVELETGVRLGATCQRGPPWRLDDFDLARARSCCGPSAAPPRAVAAGLAFRTAPAAAPPRPSSPQRLTTRAARAAPAVRRRPARRARPGPDGGARAAIPEVDCRRSRGRDGHC